MNKLVVIDSKKRALKNAFYSLCRNFNNFVDITDEEFEYAKNIAEELKNKFNDYERESIYYKYMQYIKETHYNYKNKDIMPLILIMTIDPTLYIYKIYESCSKLKDVKIKMKFIYGFADEKIIKFEKEYIKKFLNITDFDFTKKLEP